MLINAESGPCESELALDIFCSLEMSYIISDIALTEMCYSFQCGFLHCFYQCVHTVMLREVISSQSASIQLTALAHLHITIASNSLEDKKCK